MARTIFRRNDWLVLRRSAKYSWISSSSSDSGGSSGSFLKRFFVSGGGSGVVYSIHDAIMNPIKLLRNPAVNEMIWGSVIQSILCCQQIWKRCNPFFLSKNDITVYLRHRIISRTSVVFTNIVNQNPNKPNKRAHRSMVMHSHSIGAYST